MDKLMIAFTNMMDIGYKTMLIVLVILAARFLFQRMRVPGKYICLLWMIPFLSMLIPFRMESKLSVMPEEPPAVILEMREEAETFEERKLNYVPSYEITEYDTTIHNSYPLNPVKEEEQQGMNQISQWILPACSVLWIVGIGILLLYSICSYIRLRHRLSTAVLMDAAEEIYLVDNIPSPFVLCGKKHGIYLPSNMKEEMKEYVISHEKEHIRRKDPILKLIAYGACLVYWMNPFAWLAYYFLGCDMEAACDEAVIAGQDAAYRKAYAKTLLFMSVGKVNLHAVPLAFAEGNPKDRVEKIAAYKKPAFWVAAVGLICIGVLAVGLLSDPKGQEQPGVHGQTDTTGTELPESYFTGEGTYVKAAKVNLKGSTGLGGSKLYYVDEEKIIFGGYYGVFVFSKEKAKMTASVDLEELGWSEGCEVKASKDGKYVYFSPEADDFDYVYDWSSITMYRITKAWDELEAFDNLFDEERGSSFEQNGEKVYVQLVEPQSKMIGDLMYREYVLHEETRDIISDKYRHLFLEGRYTDVQAFEPEDLVPLVKAEMVIQGELRSVTDEKILKWVEENLTVTESIKGGTGCPFYNPLYLTRKDGNVGVIYPATDSCSVFRTENCNYYDYTLGYEDNSEFWSYFEGWLEGMYPDIYGKRDEEAEKEAITEDAEYVDGTWIFKGKSYRYRLEVTGRMNNAVKDTTYVIVTNDKDITFEELFPLSGLSSDISAGDELRRDTALIAIK